MRLHAARRTAPSNRSQRDGVRLQRADGENARRQSERNHSVCEHGSCWQQSGLRRLTLLPDTVILAFRNSDMSTAMAEYGVFRRGGVWRDEHHHRQRRSDIRRSLVVPKLRERRQLHCLDV